MLSCYLNMSTQVAMVPSTLNTATIRHCCKFYWTALKCFQKCPIRSASCAFSKFESDMHKHPTFKRKKKIVVLFIFNLKDHVYLLTCALAHHFLCLNWWTIYYYNLFSIFHPLSLFFHFHFHLQLFFKCVIGALSPDVRATMTTHTKHASSNRVHTEMCVHKQAKAEPKKKYSENP